MLLQFISTEEQDADILKNALSKCKFKFQIEIGSRWQIIPFLLKGSVEMWQQEYSNLIYPSIKL